MQVLRAGLMTPLWRGRFAAAAFVTTVGPWVPALAGAQAPSATSATSVVAGEPATITVVIPTENRPPGIVTYEIQPVPGVELTGGRTGPLTWDPSAANELRTTLQLRVNTQQPPGRFVAARLSLRWSNGQHETVDVWAMAVEPAAQPTSASVKDLLVQVVPRPDAAAPGGRVRLRFTIVSNEETDEHLRLRVAAGPGWRLANPEELEQRDWLLEAWDEIQGDLTLLVPEDADEGSRQLVRLLVEVAGEPGVVEGRTYVSVLSDSRGASDSDMRTLSGSARLGMWRLGGGGIDNAQSLGAFEVASEFAERRNLSFSYERGLRDNQSNYRYDERRTQIDGQLNIDNWNFTFGNLLPSMSSSILGPFVEGVGANLKYATGRRFAEITITRPSEFDAPAAGHLVRARAGIRTRTLLIAFAASDFGRPEGGYTTLPPVQQMPLSADDEDQLEIEEAFSGPAASNRVRGGGLELEFKPNRTHRFTARAGGLSLANAADDRESGLSGEAAYSLTVPRKATLNLRWRRMPPTLQGIYIQSNQANADGSLRIAGPLFAVARAHSNSSETVGRSYQSRGEGLSQGVRLQFGPRRIETRWNYRESQFSTRTIRRSISLNGATPLGPVAISGSADIGAQERDSLRTRMAYYRGDMRWNGTAGTASLGFTHSQNGTRTSQRADLVGSLNLARYEVAGGAWATRGYTFGGQPGFWASFGVPVTQQTLITIGVDHAPPVWGADPSLRFALSARKRFSMPLPFRPVSPPDSLIADADSSEEH